MTETITEKPQNDLIPSLRSANAFRLKQETEQLTKAMQVSHPESSG